MILTRRRLLRIGGGVLAGLAGGLSTAQAGSVIDIAMKGNTGGSRVWFDPVGLRIEPGQTVRWINLDPGNAHTATAYHPRNRDRPRRIPPQATPWDSGYLLPEESFSLTLTREGVYDYFCIPHERAGMVGRIIVGTPQPDDDSGDGGDEAIPEAALAAFPAVEVIMRDGAVRADGPTLQ